MAPYGLSIDTATSGIDAVQKIKDNCVYDIIFMDHMMPKMDGMEATKIIREMGYAHPIVALTANALVGQAEIFMQNGFDDFISKPIDTRDLNATLNRLIRDKQPQEVIDAAREQEKKLNITKDDKQTSITPQLADIFIRDAKKALAVLETAYNNRLQNNDDISMYVINVHAMKSALANISEQSLSDEARKLEHEARERNIEYLLSETQGFLRALHEVIIKITPKETEGGAVDESKEDVRKFLLEKFTAIQTAAGALDKKTIKKEMSSLTEKVWSPPTKKVIDSIAEHLLHSDFEEIEKEAGKFLQK
jgi:CheY-like chemotaxis protein